MNVIHTNAVQQSDLVTFRKISESFPKNLIIVINEINELIVFANIFGSDLTPHYHRVSHIIGEYFVLANVNLHAFRN